MNNQLTYLPIELLHIIYNYLDVTSVTKLIVNNSYLYNAYWQRMTPPGLSLQLYPHQQEALRWMRTKELVWSVDSANDSSTGSRITYHTLSAYQMVNSRGNNMESDSVHVPESESESDYILHIYTLNEICYLITRPNVECGSANAGDRDGHGSSSGSSTPGGLGSIDGYAGDSSGVRGGMLCDEPGLGKVGDAEYISLTTIYYNLYTIYTILYTIYYTITYILYYNLYTIL